jgi:DNA invertase Pin-like site-specific DNA recombinase
MLETMQMPVPAGAFDRSRELKARGFGATEIAKALGIGRASVYRVLNGDAIAS